MKWLAAPPGGASNRLLGLGGDRPAGETTADPGARNSRTSRLDPWTAGLHPAPAKRRDHTSTGCLSLVLSGIVGTTDNKTGPGRRCVNMAIGKPRTEGNPTYGERRQFLRGRTGRHRLSGQRPDPGVPLLGSSFMISHRAPIR
ncbi:MAG: hypothetical protein QOD31_2168 [Pseudonocardiales bacterium]|nr:hypothetical protein [Pseudonocardiales bacterium]